MHENQDILAYPAITHVLITFVAALLLIRQILLFLSSSSVILVDYGELFFFLTKNTFPWNRQKLVSYFSDWKKDEAYYV